MRIFIAAMLLLGPCLRADEEPADVHRLPAPEVFTKAYADRFTKTANGKMAPVYGPLATHIVKRFDLAERKGIGLDIGGGPGSLVFELAARTKAMRWICSDVNTWFAPHFFKAAAERECAAAVSWAFADAQWLPYRDDRFDIIVSRGSFQFWPDHERAFREIHRVLKPGGRAFIGRGISPDIPFAEAKAFRSRAGSGPKYEPDGTAGDLRALMQKLDLFTFEVLRPHAGETDINFGVWLVLEKKAG